MNTALVRRSALVAFTLAAAAAVVAVVLIVDASQGQRQAAGSDLSAPLRRELEAARMDGYAEAVDQMHRDMRAAVSSDRSDAFLVLVHAEQEGLARLARLAHDREADPVLRRRADRIARQAERQAAETKRWLAEREPPAPNTVSNTERPIP
ncbi:MAG: hypothetical protein VX561_02870 [Pseudomonadota bacterium]|nr:hypothetical protein [Pseudomonadota bacterium]